MMDRFSSSNAELTRCYGPDPSPNIDDYASRLNHAAGYLRQAYKWLTEADKVAPGSFAGELDDLDVRLWEMQQEVEALYERVCDPLETAA